MEWSPLPSDHLDPMLRLGLLAFLTAVATDAFNVTEFRRQIISYHNFLRSLHDAPPITTDPYLDGTASNWARSLSIYASDKCLHHSRAGGENIYFQWANTPISETELARSTMKAFYEEIKYYDYSRPQFNLPAAHFTNLVWRAVRQIGIGVFENDYYGRHGACNVQASRHHPARGYMVVIHHSPNSNIMSTAEFSANVLRPQRMFQF